MSRKTLLILTAGNYALDPLHDVHRMMLSVTFRCSYTFRCFRDKFCKLMHSPPPPTHTPDGAFTKFYGVIDMMAHHTLLWDRAATWLPVSSCGDLAVIVPQVSVPHIRNSVVQFFLTFLGHVLVSVSKMYLKQKTRRAQMYSYNYISCHPKLINFVNIFCLNYDYSP